MKSLFKRIKSIHITKKQLQKGSITIFLAGIMVPMLAFSGLIVDLARYKLARSAVSSAGDLALNAATADYDSVLKDVYGLFAMSQSDTELQENLKNYFKQTLTAEGVLDADGNYTSNSEYLKVFDFLNIDWASDTELELNGAANSSLADPAVLKNQIVEFQKYRTPVDVGLSMLDGLIALKNIVEQAKVTKAKTEVDEAMDDFQKECKKLYKRLWSYNLYYNTGEYKSGMVSWDSFWKNLQGYTGTKDTYPEYTVNGKLSYDTVKNAWKLKLNEGVIDDRLTFGETYYYNRIHKPTMTLIGYETMNYRFKYVDPTPDNVKESYYSYKMYSNPNEKDRYLIGVRGLGDDERYQYNRDPKQFVNTLISNVERYLTAFTNDRQYWTYLYSVGENNEYAAFSQNYNSLMENNSHLKDLHVECLTLLEYAEEFINDSEDNEEYDAALESRISNLFSRVYSAYASAKQSRQNELYKLVNSIANKAQARIEMVDVCINEYNRCLQMQIDWYKDILGILDACYSSMDAVRTQMQVIKEKNDAFGVAIDKYKSACGSNGEQGQDSFALGMQDEHDYNAVTFDDESIVSLKQFLDETYEKLKTKGLDRLEAIKYCGKSPIDLKNFNAVKTEIERRKQEEGPYDTSQIRAAFYGGAGNPCGDIGMFTTQMHFVDPEAHILEQESFWRYLQRAFGDPEASENSSVKEAAQSIVNYADDNDGSQVNGSSGITVGSFNGVNSGSLPSNGGGGDGVDKPQLITETDGDGNRTFKGFAAMLKGVTDTVTTLFSGITGALTGGIENLRDGLYVTDYAFDMFTFYTAKAEFDKKNGGSQSDNNAPKLVTPTGYEMNSGNNKLYGGEIEYLIFGQLDCQQNITSAKASIFAIRFVINSTYALTSSDIRTITAPVGVSVQAATCGIVPAKLVEVALDLALALAETAVDMNKLLSGDAVALIKTASSWTMSPKGALNAIKNGAKTQVQNLLTSAASDIKDGLSGAWNDLIDSTVEDIQVGIDDLSGDLQQSAKEKVDEVVTYVFGAVSNSLEDSLTAVMEQGVSPAQVIDSADQLANNAIAAARAKASEAMNNVFSGCDNDLMLKVKSALEAKINSVLDDIKGEISRKLREARDATDITVGEALMQIQREISERCATAITSLLNSLTDEIKDFVDGIGSQLAELGDGVIDTAVDGVRDAALDIINNAFDDAFDSISAKLPNTLPSSSGTSIASSIKFAYSDYMKVLLFLKLVSNDSNTTMKRIADLIQINIAYGKADIHHKSGTGFTMANAKTYCTIQVNVSMKTMFVSKGFMDLFVQNAENNGVTGADRNKWGIRYYGARGY